MFYAVYRYPAEVDGKFSRIIDGIRDVDSVMPSVMMASEHRELAAQRLKKCDKQTFESRNRRNQSQSHQNKTKTENSILNIEDFQLTSLCHSGRRLNINTDIKSKMSPQTPAQLVNLANAQQQRAFAENDVAELIATNQGDDYLYDSTHSPTTLISVLGMCRMKCTLKDGSSKLSILL